MSNNNTIGVVFDMDGVLVDSAEPHLRSWQRLAEENGAVVTSEQFSATFGQQNRDIIPTLFGTVSKERMAHLADRKEEIYRDLVRHNPPIVDGAVSLVRDLHRADVGLAVGSSGPLANIQLVLTAMDVTDCISVIVSGDDVTRGKPDPQVFTLSAGRLGIVPSRCVVVEDAPVGVEAARSAGTRTVAVLLHHPSQAFPQVDLIVEKLADLTAERLISLVEP